MATDPHQTESDGAAAGDSILKRCAELGFAAAGIAPARAPARPDALRSWLAAGRHGEMEWLARFEPILLDPQRLVPGARSIVCVADRYADGRRDRRDRPWLGRIARYARGADYHVVMRERLQRLRDELRAKWPAERFRVCVDTAPLLEREHAMRAGLGSIGKNTLLIVPQAGSWVLLGEIVTTLDIPPTRGDAADMETDPCGSCSRCVDACPTDAISPWSVDATRCIAYLSIEHRGPVPASPQPATGDWIFGCDICQEVCPHNQPTRRSIAAGVNDELAPRDDGFDVRDVLTWDQVRWSEMTSGRALDRARLSAWRRNAVIVAVNVVPPEERDALRRRLLAIADDPGEDASVRQAAHDGADRLAR